MFGEFGTEDDLRKVAEIVYSVITSHYAQLSQGNVFPSDEELVEAMSEVHSTSFPEKPMLALHDLRDWFGQIRKKSLAVWHSKYVGHMDSGIIPELSLIDSLISALNQNLLAWELSPIATYIERQVIGWFTNIFGLPQSTAGGTFVSGGTVANLTGLFLALYKTFPNAIQEGIRNIPPVAIFASQEIHYSIVKSASILGLGTDSVVSISTTDSNMIDLEELENAIDHSDRIPLSIIGVAGVTNSGSIDPLEELGKIARKENSWFHVDAAYGGALILSEKYREKLRGIEQANSITFDPHKWLWFPKSTAMILVRNQADLQLLDHQASYMPVHPSSVSETGIDKKSLGKQTIQGSKRFDALRVWYAFQRFGVTPFAKGIVQTIEMAQQISQYVERNKRFLRLLLEPETNIVCLRINPSFVPNLERRKELTRLAHKRLEASGNAWISRTMIKGEPVLRMVILNLNTRLDDLKEIVDLLEETLATEIENQE